MKQKKNKIMNAIFNLTLLVYVFFLSHKSMSQNLDTINFKQIESVRIYKFVTHEKFLKASILDLKSASYIQIDTIIIKPILRNSIVAGTTALWSGDVFGVIFFYNGKSKKIKISEINFKDEQNQLYYEISALDRKNWKKIIYPAR